MESRESEGGEVAKTSKAEAQDGELRGTGSDPE